MHFLKNFLPSLLCITGFRASLTRFLTVTMTLSLLACTDASRVKRTLEAYFGILGENAEPKSLDLREVIPADWRKVCIGHYPYATKSSVENRLKGTVRGKYEVTGDSNWVLFGIDTKQEITQVVLSVESSHFLSNHYRQRDASNPCVLREDAVIMSIIERGVLYVEFGSH